MIRLVVLLLALMLPAPTTAAPLVPVTTESAGARALIERLRQGGLVLYFRHADTLGMPCDRSFRVGDREGQRNISAAGRDQSRAIGRAIAALNIPIERPVLAGPVYRARDTAEEAFGPANVQVIEGLTADDFAGERLGFVLAEHRRLFVTHVAGGVNRVLVGHRTPAIMIFGEPASGRAFPEGAAMVLEPGGAAPKLLGIWMPAPIPGGGFHGC